ncbi:MAG: carboxypeptidase-like regulatory domain-containing protein [Saprospirales bacterium]|nr:carboxypeptidase-like regulatory domain-containing protein [Saprospirales bacterium]
MKNILFYIALLAFCTGATAQTLTITGSVLDYDTDEPIPFANVYLHQTTIGVAADFDGKYSITFPAGKADSLVVSAIGYVTAKKKIGRDTLQVIDFRLKAESFYLSEIVVHAGENPANEIVRRIIRNKERNRLSQFDVWQAEMYSKTELDLDEIGEEMKDQKFLKPFEFIFENIDSTSDVEPFIPAYLSESLSDVYFIREAGKRKEITHALKVSGIDNQSIIESIGILHQDYDVYDNWIEILEKPFAAPFSTTALANYEYYILDSAMVDKHWSYKLKFKPRRKQENTFYGDFWVDQETYAIEVLHMRMSPDVNINLIERVVIHAEFELHNDTLWLPSKNATILDFFAVKNGPGMIARKTSSYRNYQIGSAETRQIYDRSDPRMAELKSLRRDEIYWDTMRFEALSKTEASVYKMIDSIKNVPVFNTYADAIYSMTSGYIKIGHIEVGPWFSVYSSNAAEGNRFRFGLGTSAKVSKQYYVYGYGAYGTKDQSFKYGGQAQYNISKRPWTYFGAKYFNDIELSSESSENVGESSIFSGLFRRKIPQKLLRAQEAKLYYEQGWPKGWSNRFVILHRRADPYEAYGFPFRFHPDPGDLQAQDSVVRTTELLFSVRYAFEERFLEGNYSRISLGSRYPIVEFQYTAGIKGVLGSRFNYHKFSLDLTHWFNVPPLGWMRYTVKVGKTFGALPYLLLEVHPGNETFIFQSKVFNGMNKFEFVSDQYVEFMLEHHLEGFLLNRIPLMRKLKWREVGSFKLAWGALSPANRAINAPNNYDLNSPDPKPREGVFYGTFDRGPYLEASVGIENIFRFFRVEAVWRMNYLQNRFAVPFSVRGTVDFYF